VGPDICRVKGADYILDTWPIKMASVSHAEVSSV
jgi:hypothetical protein